MNKKLLSLVILVALILVLSGCNEKMIEDSSRAIESNAVRSGVNKAKADNQSFGGVKVKLEESVYHYDTGQKSKDFSLEEGEHDEIINSGWKLGQGFSDNERLVVMGNNQNSELKFYLQYSDCTEVIKIENEKQIYLKNEVEDFDKCDEDKTRLMAVNIEQNRFKDSYCFERRRQEEVDDEKVTAAYVKCISPWAN